MGSRDAGNSSFLFDGDPPVTRIAMTTDASVTDVGQATCSPVQANHLATLHPWVSWCTPTWIARRNGRESHFDRTHRISLLGALVAVLAPEGDVDLYTPAPVDSARLWQPLRLHAGVPHHADLAWADARARVVNDRRLALELAREHGVALPSARVITTIETLDGPWVTKAPWTAAGRDRCHGTGAPNDEQRTRLGRLLERFGSLVLEPWCDRILDVGVCATVGPAGSRASDIVVAEPPHGLLTNARGAFLGIDLAPPALEPAERDALATMVAAAGAMLASHGYAGPFAIDAFAYRTAEGRRFHPLCEINARFSFGWIARAFAARFGTTKLGFGEPPTGAKILISPAADGVTAWIA